MIDFNEARAKACHLIQNTRLGRAGELVIRDDLTREEDFGWVFFYHSRRFLETGDPAYALGGNAPILVDRETGEAQATGTAFPLEHYLEEKRAHWRSGRPR